MTAPPVPLQHGVPLAPRTTLELGGPAQLFFAAQREEEVVEGLRWAAAEGLPAALLGGGSNVVVGDEGYPGLVIQLGTRGVALKRSAEEVLLTVAAGEVWDEVVALAVAEGWAGIECLSGIPGTAGATVVQNVGAYGQEVAAVLREVRLLDRHSWACHTVPPAALGLGYRTSRLKREPGRFAVLSLTLALRPGGQACVGYGELAAALEVGRGRPSLAQVREAVLALRRSKSMLWEANDPNRRSVGSFFLNPVLAPGAAQAVAQRAVAAGCLAHPDDLPRLPAPASRVKLPAAWLVEHAGFPRGFRRGPVGISSRHALALVHHGGGSAAQLLRLAGEIIAAVEARFGVRLECEPTCLDGSPLPLA